jgi:hypothetical protein
MLGSCSWSIQKIKEEARVKREFGTKKALPETAHAAEKTRVRRDVDVYSRALLTRAEFKPIPDNELKSDLWILYRRSMLWLDLNGSPIRRRGQIKSCNGLSGNQRLQDTVWVVLEENIFCSPFRVFGEESRSLESKWNDEYGKGVLSNPSSASVVASSNVSRLSAT